MRIAGRDAPERAGRADPRSTLRGRRAVIGTLVAEPYSSLCSDAWDFLPTGTTWLDITTLVIALGGLAIAVAGFGLAFWRYRRESRVGVRVEVGLVPISGPGTLAVVLTNAERQTATIERAGIAAMRDATGVVFERWHEVNLRRSGSGLPLSDPALPKTLEPGGKPYGVVAGLASVKSTFHPDVPAWAFCVDTYRNTCWGPVPEEVRDAIRSTKRRIRGPDDERGHPTTVEIEG